MLTFRQHEALKIVVEFSKANGGVSPSLQDIAAKMNPPCATSTIHGILHRLKERGYITTLDHRARAITATKIGKVMINGNS